MPAINKNSIIETDRADSFQFGLFDAAELAEGPQPGFTGRSEYRHFDRQLEIAGHPQPTHSRYTRSLACGNRKEVEYYISVLVQNELNLQELRFLQSNASISSQNTADKTVTHETVAEGPLIGL
ncbi:hypothetical protein EYZ11_009764 [Aspergillus tanneri]|uniref:Uncharacterized protein n=1 Tax=Aspergillus tanneri TaxID=1220188 RepID=A0A4V3UND4_9EURO|nr:hypothetical protein EYZ11_009764 [Aspergillus tanneri]